MGLRAPGVTCLVGSAQARGPWAGLRAPFGLWLPRACPGAWTRRGLRVCDPERCCGARGWGGEPEPEGSGGTGWQTPSVARTGSGVALSHEKGFLRTCYFLKSHLFCVMINKFTLKLCRNALNFPQNKN